MVTLHKPGEVTRWNLSLSCDGGCKGGRVIVDGVEETLDENLGEAVDECEDEERGGQSGACYVEELVWFRAVSMVNILFILEISIPRIWR